MSAAGSGLRERPTARPLHIDNAEDARRKVLELNEEEEKEHADGSEKRTYGRTPDGTGESAPAPTPAPPTLTRQSSSCRRHTTWFPSFSRRPSPRTCPT